MTAIEKAGTWRLGDRMVKRIGYGAMQLAGPGVFGPPRDEEEAIAVLREAVESGVDHIDTSDFYGPHVTNRIIRKALHPYPDDLTIVTKIGARRDGEGNWLPAVSTDELERAVEDNLRNLGLEAIEVVNLRLMGDDPHGACDGPVEPMLSTVARLRERGLIRHIGISNATAHAVAEAQKIVPIVCVQNLYNLANRDDDALIDQLAAQDIAYVPFFPLGGFSPLQSDRLDRVAKRVGATPMQVALAWLLHRSPNILLIPGTSSRGHLRENLAVADISLDDEALAELDAIGTAAA
ncbi:aldo/keto reductase family oxidoreductase [Stakelama sp. CBK3Z-3]|uniref:Aldo/keto reductase family oxidoreductase n=1 Tax=Stakelama flava TaxID=2860338 RepID=A0ABS6XIE6_9SPHN|nr:aldo/keto reductase family oxidoreductase [Stakelama flava]MBW4329979.1 aldo/keto reductase family oxidoreductase [Stakelama flava]